MPRGSDDLITYAAPQAHEQEALRAMARRSFSETFSHLYAPEPFLSFLDHTYGPGGKMDQDLNDSTVRWLIAFSRSEPIGYAKLTPLRARAPTPLVGAVELQQIYVLRDWHGSGVAAHLMEWALASAAAARAPEIYLTVFDHNERAKRFYRRFGFVEVGHCNFILGDRIDDDRIWRRACPPDVVLGTN